jgi:hypothetical protein
MVIVSPLCCLANTSNMCMQVYPVHFISSWHKHTPPSHVQSWCAWPCNVPYSFVKPIQHMHWCIPISTDQFNILMCIYIYSITIYTYIQYIHLYSKLTCDDFIHRPISLKNCRYPQESKNNPFQLSDGLKKGWGFEAEQRLNKSIVLSRLSMQ